MKKRIEILILFFIVSLSSFAQFRGGNGSGAHSRINGAFGPLPIELMNFTATPRENKYVDLKWTTSSETNNNFFTVEKSGDAQSFFDMGKVNGAGNSSVQNDYALTDNAPLKGLSYYKLKQTDNDGKFSYSKIVPVTITSPGSVIISRNNASGNYLINFITSSDITQDYIIEIANAVGQVFYKETLTNFNGNYSRDYDFITQGKGVYLVSITSSTDKIVKRVIAY